MKKLFLLSLTAILFSAISFSQKRKDAEGTTRCGTMLRVEKMFENDPELRKQAHQLSKIPAAAVQKNYRTNAIITIPVVVHIVLPNPDFVTDADVEWQIAKLNKDFSGLNPDSINIPPEFQVVRGHSQIRFVLARRNPAGILTNGIDRIKSSIGSDVNKNTDPIKRTSLGGADVWNPNTYLNFWVGIDGSGQGILGYAQFPASGSMADDGVFINAVSWGNNPCYTAQGYNLGRTAVHETGHYLGLLHIWGDDGGSCSGDDFKSLSTVGSSCNLPVGLFNPDSTANTAADIGDTPNQSSETTICPSGVVTDACSPNAPGKMYQNYMDYTQDACYSMFTKKQVERMEYVLTSCRSGLTTSMAATNPSGAISLDASPVLSVSPGGSEVIGCTSFSYPSTIPCPGNFTPKVRIRNNGLYPIDFVTVGMIINGGAPVTQTLNNPNLYFGNTTVVTFPSVPVTTGTYIIKFFTKNPNGVNPDQVPSNDTLLTIFTVATPLPIPVTEGFEGNTFPPPGWTIRNLNGDFTWIRVTPGHNSNYSAAIDNYNNDASGKIDELRTPRVTFTPADSVLILAFDVAHKYYPDSTNYDTLTVLVSKDCGATFTTVYKKYGPELASADTSTDAYITPADSDWRRDKITLRGSILSAGNIIVAFRNTNRFGNNIFLDNISITPPEAGDLQLLSIDKPAAIICDSSVMPTATVKNIGSEIIAGFNISYKIDNNTIVTTNYTGLNLLPGTQMSVALNPPLSLTPGAYTIKVFISNVFTVSGATDQNQSNDTLSKTLSLTGKATAPLTEGFESTTFPSAGWAVDNPDGSITWERTTSAAKSGAASMVIRNFDYPVTNTIDKFVSPLINGISNYDSLLVSFDFAYALGAAGATGDVDTLEIQVTKDCGQTFSTVFKKWGAGLQTATASGRFTPTANDWKNIKVDLTPYVKTPSFQLYFVAKGNKQNNLYIDNINVYGVTLPQKLKDQGYLIYPNPFSNSFAIQHYLPPINLLKITMINSMGQKVWQTYPDGPNSSFITVRVPNLSPGVYILNLIYKDKVIVERVVKH